MSNPNFYSVAHQDSEIRICCISLNSTDRIRLISVPQAIIPSLHAAIVNSWGTIKSEKNYNGGYEFKLKGDPWLGNGESAVLSRRLLSKLLTCMAENGWNIIQASDSSKKANDKDTLFFEYNQPDPEAMLFAMSFNMSNRIRLIDAPETMHFSLKKVVEMHTKIKSERDYYGAMEIKVSGSPWWSDGEAGITTKILLCQILANFRAAGYKFYASVDISYGTEDGGDLDTWIFRKTTSLWQ